MSTKTDFEYHTEEVVEFRTITLKTEPLIDKINSYLVCPLVEHGHSGPYKRYCMVTDIVNIGINSYLIELEYTDIGRSGVIPDNDLPYDTDFVKFLTELGESISSKQKIKFAVFSSYYAK